MKVILDITNKTIQPIEGNDMELLEATMNTHRFSDYTIDEMCYIIDIPYYQQIIDDNGSNKMTRVLPNQRNEFEIHCNYPWKIVNPKHLKENKRGELKIKKKYRHLYEGL